MDKKVLLDDENEVENKGFLTRMYHKVKADPVVPLGMAGWTGIVAYGLYRIKNRKLPLGLHLIHLRVQAQAFVVGAMTLAVVYNIGRHTIGKDKENISNAK